MRRTSLLLLLPAIVLGLLALVVKDASPEERLVAAADRLQQRIDEAQTRLVADLDRVRAAAQGRSLCVTESAWSVIDADLRAQRTSIGAEYLIHCDTALTAWSGTAPLEQVDAVEARSIRRTNGCWLRAHRSLNDDVHVDGLREVWYAPPFENRYLHGHFHPSLDVEQGIEAAMSPGLGPVVRDAEGAVLFRLLWKDDTAPPGDRARWRVLFALACVVLFAAFAWRSLARVAANGRPWSALVVMGALCGVCCQFVLSNGPAALLSGFSWADPDLFASASMPSFADLLIVIALLLLACAFARHALRSAAPPRWPAVASGPALAVLLFFAAGIDEVVIALVRDSRIPLDLFHAQELDADSVVALLAVAALLFAWTLLADGLVRWILQALSSRIALSITAPAFVVAHVIYHQLGEYDSMIVLWPLPVLLALGVMRRGGMRSVALLTIIVTHSLFTVHVINRQTFKRGERDRAALAESAVTREDPVVEWLFREARTAIAHDPAAMALLTDTSAIAPATLDARLRLPFFQGAWDAYDVRLHLFGANGRARGTTSRGAIPVLSDLRERFGQGVPVEGDTLLRNTRRPLERALYIGQAGVGAGGILVVELLPRALPEAVGFPELLMAGDRAMDRRTDRYARARYERGALVESSGTFAFPVRWTEPVPGDGLEQQVGRFSLFATGDAANTVVVIATRMPGWMDHVTTFSYVLILFSLLAAAFLLLRAFPARRSLVFGVVGKLRAGILLLACIAVALFAVGARWLLNDGIRARTTEQLDERSRSALAELRRRTHAESRITPAMFPDIDRWIDRAATLLLTDITVYTPAGRLMATSREQVFNNGLIGRDMDPAAFEAMTIDHRSAFTHEERIGDAEFLATYRPLLNDDGELLAYVEVPYFARQGEVEDARAAGYVAVANLFVLLLLIGSAAAAIIATWTTRPLASLKRGLERIELGARNEPLPYQGDDELGELVRVYNRKVEELRVSAEMLARSERESAWKEMARQVAHEIKNPLTPMKLGIQHFQHTWDPHATDAKAKLDRFTASMVEQIDALSRVAGDFSRFAQMSAAKEELVDLNEVARNAVALFAGEPNADITLQASSPLFVKADREHLLRVFNNLIKNATQAIPGDRRGRIDVTLHAAVDHAVVEVRDNGTGIPEEVRGRIFEPSFTTKTSGMGLGLAMVKRMVEQAEGSVSFKTTFGSGTVFSISIPLAR